jgi:ribosome maturation factor RimP
VLVERVTTLLTQAIETNGYEVIQIKVDGRRHVRVWIDREPEGVNLQDCTMLNRAVRTAFEEDGLDSGTWGLEILSPGIDRPIVRDKDFARYAGEPVQIRLQDQGPGQRRRYKGTLVGLEDGHVLVTGAEDESWRWLRESVAEVRLDPKMPFPDAGKHEEHQKVKRPGKHRRKQKRSRRKG